MDSARYWRHPALPRIELLRARFVTTAFGRHTHEGYAIGVIEAGVEEFECQGTTHRAAAGEMVVVHPEHVHTGHAATPEGWVYRMLYPDPSILTSIAAEVSSTRGTPFFPARVVSDPTGAELLRAAHRAAERGDALASSSLVRTAFGALLRCHARLRTVGPAQAAPRHVEAAREILHARLVDPPTLEELALMVGARPFPLLRAFRSAVGLPPHAYLNQVRVSRARSLLADGKAPGEVALTVGFADQAHLTRHFKRALGVPPGAFARDLRNFVQDPAERPI